MHRKIAKLSIIMPVYNEKTTVVRAIKQVLAARIGIIKKELIIINDGSTDGTAREIEKIKDKRVKVISRVQNKGKGSAIRAGLNEITGQVVIIQDADLEYDPNEYMMMLSPIIDGKADVVYGSRFMGSAPHRVLFFWHMVGNKFLTLVSNAMTNLNLTDVNTCYKAFRTDVAKKITLEEDRFGFDPEFTAKIARLKCKIYEVGISYHGRGYEEGKKIGWIDGFRHLYCMFKYNLSD